MPIFDQGYQHWSGHLSGHTWRWLAIARHGVRVGMKGRILRIWLLVSIWPALLLAAALCLWGLIERQSSMVASITQFLSVFFGPLFVAEPRHFRVEVWTICYHYFLRIELWFAMILILLVGPNLISQDLRFNALPLYFSRPLRRIDYFLGKLGVIAFFLGRIIVLPCVIAYVLGLAFSLDITIIRDTYKILIASVLYGLVITFSAGLLILALSSLSRNSRYIALFWLGLWFVSSIVASVLTQIEHGHRYQSMYRETMEAERAHRPNPSTMSSYERRQYDRARHEAFQKRMAKVREEELRAAPTAWRPMVAYTTNLARIGDELLKTNQSWESLAKLLKPADREEFLAEITGPQHPWYWSAGVLIALFGISVCILQMNIKSLDRLK